MIENSSVWLVCDVDGTLMDHSYDLSPAKETIKKLQKLSIPVILCTSKTASEVKVIRKELNLTILILLRMVRQYMVNLLKE